MFKSRTTTKTPIDIVKLGKENARLEAKVGELGDLVEVVRGVRNLIIIERDGLRKALERIRDTVSFSIEEEKEHMIMIAKEALKEAAK